MMRLSVAMAVALSLCVVAPMASAQEQAHWTTVHAAGDPRITIDIPANTDQETNIHPEKGQLMALFFTDEVACFLNREEYSEEHNQKFWAEFLAGSKIGLLCKTSGDNISQYEAIESQSTTSNGFPAATCVSSYTDSEQKERGRVLSELIVAAPGALYTLSCQTRGHVQAMAMGFWEIWKDAAVRMQGSLHLPDSKK
jgi:hypothetical protein